VDISADDYDTKVTPIQIKGIEGIPTGSLDQIVFQTDDPAYSRIPAGVRKDERRVVVSCYSWPGVHPHACLDRYERQLTPFLRLLAKTPVSALNPHAEDYYNRALARSMYEEFEK
jgi:alanine dehydrogenase